ncbi:MAG: SDR family NAD(P)-dependent oxidoreductase [Dehalococcoidales bacterium]|nr:SDR family NAD(P)-dependent oxidoreductase [Dehalococcoidales bacterium]
MDLGLKGKVAIVTGAGSQKGFGKTTALTLATEGCDVVVADIDLNGAEKTAAEIRASGYRAIGVRVDVASSLEVNAMVNQTLNEFKKIDILVNIAGATTPPKLFIDKTEAEWDQDINLNLRGVLNCVRAVLPYMLSRKSGKIINIASVNVKKGFPTTSVYAAAKAGVVGFTQVLANEVAGSGINVNCIAPGLGLTNFIKGDGPPGGIESIIACIPNKRATTPQDIANTVAFLVSDVSSDIVGQTISVDGGTSII